MVIRDDDMITKPLCNIIMKWYVIWESLPFLSSVHRLLIPPSHRSFKEPQTATRNSNPGLPDRRGPSAPGPCAWTCSDCVGLSVSLWASRRWMPICPTSETRLATLLDLDQEMSSGMEFPHRKPIISLQVNAQTQITCHTQITPVG